MQTKITLGSISTGTIGKGPSAGRKFTMAKDSTVHFAGGDQKRTVMAFADQRETVLKSLRKGTTATFTTVFEGGVLKILGPAKPVEAGESAEG